MYFLKPLVQKIFRGMAGNWMTPNQASLLGTISFCLVGILFYFGSTYNEHHYFLILVPIFIIFRIAFNALDGLLAREKNMASAAGEIANELLDILGDLVCYGFLLFTDKISFLVTTIFFTLIWICEFVAVLAKSFPKGHRRQESFGGGKPERMLFLGIYSILLFIDIKFLDYLNIFVHGLCVLIFLTILKRVRASLKEIGSEKYQSTTRYGK